MLEREKNNLKVNRRKELFFIAVLFNFLKYG